MTLLPQNLFSAALRVLWEHGRKGDNEGVRLLAVRVAGFHPRQEQYLVGAEVRLL